MFAIRSSAFRALMVAAGSLVGWSLPAQSVGLLREVWEGIPGTAVSDLTSSPDFPDRPSSTGYVTELFESPTDVLENYGQRLHGYLVAPQTGNYTFWIASDDGGVLFLSTDEKPANARTIATVNGWTPSREWGREPNQQSSPIRLIAGQAYYVAALMKEGGGGDNLAVRWRWPDGTDQAPIVGTNLLPWGVSFTPPAIDEQPASTTAVEGDLASFRVNLSSVGPATFQWYRNEAVLPGADAPELSYGPVSLADQGARFRVVISNTQGSATSDTALLTVTPDVTPPALAAVLNIGTTLLRVTFSEPVAATSALDPNHYQLSPSRSVRAVAFGADPRLVELTVDPLVLGQAYTLTVREVQDRAQSPNTIPTGSQIVFTPVTYAPAAVGEPPVPGRVTDVATGADVEGSGTIGTRADTHQFAYQRVTGDFDRRVRVVSFTPTDPFAAAGWMARATLNPDSAMAAALVTPAQMGAFFLSRAQSGQEAVRSGGHPPNFPEMWLRLARRGSTFQGYASWDGAGWTELGRATLALPGTVYLGFAVGSNDDASVAIVQFREAGDASGGTLLTQTPRPLETLGPSSRHTALTISEIHYHPRERDDGRKTEFVEIYNGDLIDQDLTGHRLSGAVSYIFPDGYVLPAGGFAVVARSPGDLAAVYGIAGVLGPFERDDNLPNDSGVVRLRNPQGAVLLEATYGSRPPWPASADGAGHSLVLSRPSFGEGDPRAWSASDRLGGSPGSMDGVRPNPYASLLINEVLAHTDLPQLDLVELYNHSREAVNLSGCVLTDDPTTNRFRIPEGILITPGGFVAFYETQLGFRLNAAGETVYLFDPEGTRVLDAVRFGPQENGVSSGRFPDGTPEWRRLTTVTPAAENAPFRVSDVVLNEILYAPISGDDDDEFVELHNRTGQPVDLGDWSLSDGVDYRFPQGAVLPARGYVVVSRNRTAFLARHPDLSADRVFGDYAGSLSNGGERLALARPDWIAVTNAFGGVENRRIDIDVDEVTYGTGGRWGRWSDGLGSSLELVDPNSDHRQPSNWADSDESAKAPWTLIEFTGRVDNVASGIASDRLHLLAQGPGEYLVDEIAVLDASGASRLNNGGFSSGLTGWTPQGNHRASVVEEGSGIGGGRALRVIATGRGDTAVNRVRASLTSSLPANANATIRARVRWLRGWPEFLLRTRGSGIEAYGRLQVPTQPGTPGAPNSRTVANAGPALYDVTHNPTVPADRQAVVVTARATDPDGIGSVVLRYRADPSTTLSSVAMRDDGTGGDAVAGDGVYSATLSGRPSGTLVAFRIEATDQDANPATNRFPDDAPAREALIRWGEERPGGNLGVYRLWQRRADYDRLRSREPLANDNLDCTFVYGDERVIYNAEMRGKGSPWHGGSVGADYIFSMPDDDRLLGARDLAVVTLGNLGNDPSAQREQAAFWIGRQLGIPTLHRRHLRFFENGGFKGLYEDTEEPNGLYADRWFPEGPDGELFKIEDWFEFNDTGNQFQFSRDATLQPFTSAGTLKLARYRWAWRKRAVVESANDYDRLFDLVETLNGSGADFVPRVESLVDVDGWLRTFALQHIVGNWDAYGYNRGKNSYAYLPQGGRWKMIPWDIDFVLGSGSDSALGDVFGVNDPTISKLWNTPAFRRVYWRAFQDAVNGPLREEAIGPILDGRYAALTANGFNLEGTAGIKAFVNQRRSYLQGRLRSEDVTTLTITSNGGAGFSTNRNLVRLEGTAPIAAATLAVNGVPFPVTWTSVTGWSLDIPLAAAVNPLQVTARDRSGRELPGLTDSITVRYTGPLPDAAGLVVIQEIQFDPPPGGAEFVELYNASATRSFDLSGWRLDGVDFEFPAGTILTAGGYAVVTSDIDRFRVTYGTSVIPVGVFQGSLQNNGERLRLLQPGSTPDQEAVLIDELRYESEAPWPIQTRNLGPSLQLIDPTQDNRRPANWAAADPEDSVLATPGRANTVRASLEPFPSLWLNEVCPQPLAGHTDGAGDLDPWIEIHNSGGVSVSLEGLYLTRSTNLTAWAFPAGSAIAPGQFLVVWCDGEPAEGSAAEPHTSFRLAAGSGSVTLSRLQGGRPAVLDHVAYADLPDDQAWGNFPDGDPLRRRLLRLPTPGAANTLGAPPLEVVINEWMTDNPGSVLDPADGDADDWFELYNAGDTPADLSALTLTDTLDDPEKFRIPNGTVIPPRGFLLVWADEEPGQTTPGQLHVNFRLASSGETIALIAPDGTVVDSVTFGPQADPVAEGRFPDGGPEPFARLDVPTPAAPNALASANQAPALAAIDDQRIDEGAVLALQATATDPDAGQALTFSLVTAPDAAGIDPASGVLSWATAEVDGPGTYPITVRVADDGSPSRSDSRTFQVTVREVNQPPVLDPVSPRSVNEGDTLELSWAGRDADLPPQALTYALIGSPPEGVAIDPVRGVLTWKPSEAQGPADYSLQVRVSDDGQPPLSATQTVTVSVREVDNAPEFDPVGLQLVDELKPFAITLVARDPDTPPRLVRYQLDAAPSGAALDPVTGVFRWTPSESDGPGSYNIAVRATQEGGGPDGVLAFSLVVDEVNQAPEVDPLPDRVVAEGTELVFTVQARDADLPAQRLAYRLEGPGTTDASLDPDTGVFRWRIPEDSGAITNTFTVAVSDNAIDAATSRAAFSVRVEPQPRIVINEIQYAPVVPGAAFIELFNPSQTTAWSLGGWHLSGFEFDLPQGTRLDPTNYLVVAQDLTAFRTAHGSGAVALGGATPALSPSGLQWVRLQRPRGDLWETVDEVPFERAAPWPTAAAGSGASLQLIDARQDNRRVANWAAQVGTTAQSPVPVLAFTNAWRYWQSGPAPEGWREAGFDDRAWPSGPGLLYVEDASLPAPKGTALTRTEGRMTYYFRTRFLFAGNPDGALLQLSTIVDDSAVVHLNGREVFRLGLDPTAVVDDATSANRTVSDAVEEGPFTIAVTNLLRGENVLAVEVHQVNATSSDIVWGSRVEVIEVRRDPATPGYANSVRRLLPPFPGLWLHEVQPQNATGWTDNAGDHDPWIELLNAGNEPADLAGWWLTDDLAQLTKWAFPSPAPVAARSYPVIWTDGEPAESTATVWHTNFRLPQPRGLIALVREQEGLPAVMDYLRYDVPWADQSFGAATEADPLTRGVLAVATPGAPNAANRPPVLGPLPDRQVRAGELLAFDVAASDPDWGQTLTYELAAGAPSGAILEPNSGRFSWRPTTDQVGSHSLTIWVTDNGLPPLAAQRSSMVTVLSAGAGPEITSASQESGDQVRLTWTATAGRSYRVEASETMPPVWMPATPLLTAESDVLSQSVPVEPGVRFFRVVELE